MAETETQVEYYRWLQGLEEGDEVLVCNDYRGKVAMEPSSVSRADLEHLWSPVTADVSRTVKFLRASGKDEQDFYWLRQPIQFSVPGEQRR